MEYQAPTIAVATHRGIDHRTRESLDALRCRMVITYGVSDTSLARNVQLSRALRTAQKLASPIVLMVDDDMVFSKEVAQATCQAALLLGRPVSAMCAVQAGHLAGAPWPEGDKQPLVDADELEPWMGKGWLTGCAFLAIPTTTLIDLAMRSETLTLPGEEHTTEFTWSCSEVMPDKDDPSKNVRRWLSEDYRLALRLGGVVMAPYPIGHVKPIPLWPDEESIARLKETGSLEEVEELLPPDD